MKKFFGSWHLPAIIIVSILLLIFNLPGKYQTWLPKSIQESDINLGLDLQGGSQLDYKIDLRDVPEGDRKDIVDGVTEIIDKRVNSLGVSEPNIYTSKIGDEQHIIVELAGIKDLEEAKATVGKTIQLEFKEKNNEISEDQLSTIRTQAEEFIAKVDADQFEVLAAEEAKAYPSRIEYEELDYNFLSNISGESIKEAIQSTEVGAVVPRLIEDNKGFVINSEGQLRSQEGYFAIKVLDKKENVEREIPKPKTVESSHILIAYEGAEGADAAISRTKEEANELAKEIIEKAATEDFAALAKEFSNDPGSKDNGGKIDVVVKEGASLTPTYIDAALELDEQGEITNSPVESPFGYHIIKADNITAASVEKTNEDQYKLAELFFSTEPDPWKATELNGQHFQRADVAFDQTGFNPIVSIQFDAEGAKLFEEITERNVGKQVAIFVGGEQISSPTVNQKISGGQAIITGNFTIDEASLLARDLNTGAIPAPITLAGQYTIGASLGHAALVQSIQAGIIGLVALALFMLAYYRLQGLFANVALLIYSILLMFLIKVDLPTHFALLISLVIYGALCYKIFNSEEPFWEKTISWTVSTFALFFFTFLLSNPVVLTLAGVAGVILSIGMAVDANVLIFERIREELREGKPYIKAVQNGFDRAWSSIRDSNFSSLITCAILYYFGSSIIRGFALNLAAGILVSMFTAITVTRGLMLTMDGKKIVENKFLMNSGKDRKPMKIIEKSKFWMAGSLVIIIVGVISLFTNGIQAGIDFKGGTLMDVSFSQEVEVNETKIKEIFTTTSEELLAENPEAEFQAENIANPSVISSGDDSYIIRFGFIEELTHDRIIDSLKELDTNLEEKRFTTIGPLISQSLKEKAVIALLIALAAIVLFIAFAFRNVPKSVGKWRFGICAMIALAHDVLITLGIFSLLKLEVDALFITALLTIIGFSIHDTIVVFDRLRENLKGFDPKKQTFADISNRALTETMSRSINTSFSTLLTLVALLLLGSPSIFNFILALVLGVAVGTYSSIFVATPVLNLFQKRSK